MLIIATVILEEGEFMKIQMYTSVFTTDFHYGGGEIYNVPSNLISEELAKKFVKLKLAKVIEEDETPNKNTILKKSKKKVVKDIED